MIIVKLRGGLGNQMFQYALGRNLALKNNTRLKFDITELKRDKLRNYELNIFQISADILSWFESVFLRTLFKIFHGNYAYIREKSLHFDRTLLEKKGNLYLDGYWPCEKYFRHIRDILKKDFEIRSEPNKKNKLMLKKIKNTNSVCIHVRRGDYVKNPKTNKFHGTCSLKYYYNSIKRIEKKVKNPVFFVFSDDLGWSKKNLKINHSTVFVDINGPENGCEDLRLMSNCNHFIIANSSFSWWGAWLSENEDKIIFAPKRWFNGSDGGDIIPKVWIRIEG